MKRVQFQNWRLLVCMFLASGTLAMADTNIVQNGSFEDLDAHWQWCCQLGVHPNSGSADGRVHVTVYGHLAQTLDTVPGRLYVLSYALESRSTAPTVKWGGVTVGSFTNLFSAGYWTYRYTYVQAESNLTDLRFEGGGVIDDVRVFWVEEPIVIALQPEPRSAYEGGTVSFAVAARGAPPLAYQWMFNGAPIDGATNLSFTIFQARTNHSGNYSVVVNNAWQSTQSSNAALQVVPPPTVPVIVSQPADDIAPAGYAVAMGVFAVGEPPLLYEWTKDGLPLQGATNRSITFESVHMTNAGTYRVTVSNNRGSALSLPAVLTVTNATGGGQIVFDTMTNNAPIYDVDGVTRLGSNFRYHVYVGPTPVILRPVGAPRSFFNGSSAGFIRGYIVTIPDVPPGETVYVQVRAWEASAGATYEEARAAGGKFGFSMIEPLVTSTFLERVPMQSFSLRAGEPFFVTGVLSVGERLPSGQQQFVLTGEAGMRYLIETRMLPNDWVPLLVLTNTTGMAVFTDPNEPHQAVQFYRARILD